MKVRVYLDTFVLSAYYDERSPDRMAETREFWGRIEEFEASVSSLVLQEIEQTVDGERRKQMTDLLQATQILAVSEEMRELAGVYVANGLFGSAMYNDALHVAAAVLSRQDILVSWNFRHLVNRRKRAQVDQLNVSLGLPSIEILAPSEM